MTGSDPVYPLSTESLRERSVRGAAIVSAAQALRFCLLLGSQILLARLLEPADFGIVAMVAPILGFVTVMADLGIVQSIVQRPVLTLDQLNSVFWLNNLLSLSMSLVLMLTAPLLAAFYGEPRLVPVTVALAALVAVTGLSMQQLALLNRTMRFKAIAVAETVSQAIGLLVSGVSAWKGFGYWSLVLGQAATTMVTGLIVWGGSSWRPSRPAFHSEAFAMLRFGGNVTVSNVAMYLNTVVDNVAIGYWLGSVALGFYDRAWKLVVMPLTQLMAPINRVAVPALTRVVDDPDRYRRAFSQMLRLLLIVSLPGLAVAVVAAQPLIEILFGMKWSSVAPVFSWLCAGSLLTPLNTATFWIFISQGRARDQMIYGTAAAVINMAAYIVGVHWGLIGVARTSTIVAFLLPTPLLVIAAARSGPVSMTFLLRLLYPFVISTVFSMGCVMLYHRLFGITGLLDLVGIVVIAYIATLSGLICFPSGRAALESVVAAFRTLVSSRSGA